MRRPSRSPLSTLFMLALVGGLAWAAWTFLVEKKDLFASAGSPTLEEERKTEIRDAILNTFGNDECFSELGPLYYRAKEGRYRIDVKMGQDCNDVARGLCERISDLVDERFHMRAQVWAYDSTGRELGRYIP